MAGFQAWVRHLFAKPQQVPPRPSLPQEGTTLPERPSSFGRDLDAMAVAAETSITRAELLASSADDHNAFAVALYEQLYRKGGNQFFSPFSIRTALAMTFFGARGETAAQMREALHISSPDSALHASNADIARSLITTSDAAHEMAVTNSLWSQVGAPIEPAFVDLIARHYGGDLRLVDFRRDVEVARAEINQWVSDRTKARIRDILPQLAEDTRLVLVNAVYFKALWAAPFDKDRTREEPFFLEGGGDVRAPLMHQVKEMGYLQGPHYQAVTLSYRRAGLSLLVLLPDRRDGLPELETAFSAGMVKACLQVRGTRRVELFLPRFKIMWGTADLHGPLAALRMRLAFTRQADFSGINGRAPPDEDSLFLSSVFHKAFVDVNEEGTEAAAATAASMMFLGLPSPPPPVPIFRADHPFLFAICDRVSGAIIFLGRMLNPTRQS